MITGVQFRGTLQPNETQRWFTFNWSAPQHVLWEVVPTTARSGAAEIVWDVAIERADATHVTYWITIVNLTNAAVQFEARYAIIATRVAPHRRHRVPWPASARPITRCQAVRRQRNSAVLRLTQRK